MTVMLSHLVRAADGRAAYRDESGLGLTRAADLLLRVRGASLCELPCGFADGAKVYKAHPEYGRAMEGVFLPSPRTWVETPFLIVPAQKAGGPRLAENRTQQIGQIAFLAEQVHAGIDVKVLIRTSSDATLRCEGVFRIPIKALGATDDRCLCTIPAELPRFPSLAADFAGEFCSLLRMLNLPCALRVADMPLHTATQRRLRAHLGASAALTVRTVRVDPFALDVERAQPVDHPHEVGYARHWCRQHIRRLPGGLTTKVRGHWRGDPDKDCTIPRYLVGLTGARRDQLDHTRLGCHEV